MEQQVNWAREQGSGWLFPTLTGNQPTKAGWANTFQQVAHCLGLPLTFPSGVRKSGHSARASGAVFLAQNHTELWRIQLFGRWGSEVFRQYIRDAPLSQLTHLAQEASLQSSLRAAKAELAALWAQTRDPQAWRAKSGIQSQTVATLADCSAAAPLAPSVPLPEPKHASNRSPAGKVHVVACSGGTLPPHAWRTTCFWCFARYSADYLISSTLGEGKIRCAKCFKPSQSPVRAESGDESSSSSSSGESSCASQVG